MHVIHIPVFAVVFACSVLAQKETTTDTCVDQAKYDQAIEACIQKKTESPSDGGRPVVPGGLAGANLNRLKKMCAFNVKTGTDGPRGNLDFAAMKTKLAEVVKPDKLQTVTDALDGCNGKRDALFFLCFSNELKKVCNEGLPLPSGPPRLNQGTGAE